MWNIERMAVSVVGSFFDPKRVRERRGKREEREKRVEREKGGTERR
jgi:hypothetical protein